MVVGRETSAWKAPAVRFGRTGTSAHVTERQQALQSTNNARDDATRNQISCSFEVVSPEGR